MTEEKRMSNAASLEEQWKREADPVQRAALWQQLMNDRDAYEHMLGLYPDVQDENFLPKLMRKYEFQELKQKPVQEQLDTYASEGKDPCALGETEEFALTSVQKFVSRFLNPRMPYHSALIYHGVGVGKTCTAVTIAESFLDLYPHQKILVVSPRNIIDGFKREIFDINALQFGEGETDVNTYKGCTGNIYLQLTNSFLEKRKSVIENRVTTMINKRYEFRGYTAFAQDIEKKIEVASKYANPEEVKRQILREEFSNRVLIIDEAHNLRDENLVSEDDDADDASVVETKEGRGGKQLTPFLLDVLQYAENLSLVLMTATPMYNSYREIIFLLNLLLLNEKRTDILKEREIFDLKQETFRSGGDVKLGRIASQFVSFMRGENPLKFPVRLEPEGETRLTVWAEKTLREESIPNMEPAEDGKRPVEKLPILEAFFTKEAEEAYYEYSLANVAAKGLGITVLDKLVQAGNFIFPGEEDPETSNVGIDDRLGKSGFSQTFEKEMIGSIVQYRDVRPDRRSSWMVVGDSLRSVSAKAYVLLQRLETCVGVSFVFSRFVDAGALAIALALEANGYLPWGRDIGLLADGNRHPDGMMCALCHRRERGHGQQPEDENGRPAHMFRQARYILLTGSEELSPQNTKAIQASRMPSNKYGADVKVIVGSQITSVGLDFKFVREIFVFDSWYHLNKLDQVVGRGIRNCSHALLPPALRNCTVSLLVNRFANHMDLESVDMQSYRIALSKAVSVGQVTRVLKAYALDCNLNHDAILVQGLEPIPMRDSQNVLRPAVDRNDVPFTAMCDWLETCSYTCKTGKGEELEPYIPKDLGKLDYTTYDEYIIRQQLGMLKKYIVEKITETPFVDFATIQKESGFVHVSSELLRSVLNEMIFEKERITSSSYGSGYIVYRNGYYVFQPESIQDTNIPLAIRLARIPVPRDHYPPQEIILSEEAQEVFTGSKLSETEENADLWTEVKSWAEAIRQGKAITWILRGRDDAHNNVPAGVFTQVKKLRQSIGVTGMQAQKLEMITWIYTAVKDDVDARHALADVMMQYMWDEFIPVKTQKDILLENPMDASLQAVSKESFWNFKGRLYVRFRNYTTNAVEYYCPGTLAYERCSDARVADIERAKGADPLLQRPINTTTTGFQYGFVGYNPKLGQIVFKRAKPPAEGKKLTRGEECASSSQTSHDRRLLEQFGELLRTAGKHDFGLHAKYMGLAERHVENSIRLCTLSNLTLRYMDAQKVEGKRWFYRPIESKVQGHPQPRT